MRTLFLLSWLANVLLAIVSIRFLPNPVATHFGFDGTADGFMPPGIHAMFLAGTTTFLLVLFSGLSFLIPVFPSWCYNIPHKDYWLNEENRSKTIGRLQGFLDECGVGMMAFFLFVQVLIVQANRTLPPRLDPALMWSGVGMFLALAFIEIVRLAWAFRLPKETEDRDMPSNHFTNP